MTRILILETAHPKRVCDKARQIIRSGIYPNPEISIVCDEKNSRIYEELAVARIYGSTPRTRRLVVKELLNSRFDAAFCFWTGEHAHRWRKLLWMGLKADKVYVLSGDGNEFALTWKSLIRHLLFRWKHPLPTDYWDYVEPVSIEETSSREIRRSSQILIVQSAEPAYVLRSLERLKQKPLFLNPAFTLFCRNRPEILAGFRQHPMISEIISHTEAKNSWRHLRSLRRKRFDAVLLYLTGDPSYRKVKLFAFLLGSRNILVFNESNDCFFFNLRQWMSLIFHRMREKQYGSTNARWNVLTRGLLSLILKSALLPFRFLWLLLVWLRLRIAGLICLRENHDNSL